MTCTDHSQSRSGPKQDKPLLSVIIPVRTGEYPDKAISCLTRALVPNGSIEMILVEGRAPSLQRNEAVDDASADILYFLDDDSYIEPDAINEGLRFFGDDRVTAVGGPAVTERGASFVQYCIGEVFGSFLGGFLTRARSKPIGDTRIVAGEELIFCNLMMRKAAYQQVSGLDTRLFPGEDTELIKRLSARGALMYYHPGMVAYRTRRASAFAFAKQCFSYGKGRGRHILEGTRPRDFVFLAPALFLIYVLALPFTQSALLGSPLVTYLALAAMSSIQIGICQKSALMSLCVFPLFPLMHLSYGAGMTYGLAGYLFRRSREKTSPIAITIVQVGSEAGREGAFVGSMQSA